jgi:hypothetical protein
MASGVGAARNKTVVCSSLERDGGGLVEDPFQVPARVYVVRAAEHLSFAAALTGRRPGRCVGRFRVCWEAERGSLDRSANAPLAL